MRAFIFILAAMNFAPTEDSVDDKAVSLQNVIRVKLALIQPKGAFRRETETAGLVSALMERGLNDLAGVIPIIEDVPGFPSNDDALSQRTEEWRARLEMGTEYRHLTFSLTLCDPVNNCATVDSEGTRDEPYQAVGALLVGASKILQRGSTCDPELWSTPPSKDSYALIMAGRSAATFYGMLPPVAPEFINDRRKDPILRAVFLDPGIAVAQGIYIRRALQLDDLAHAWIHADVTGRRFEERYPAWRAERASMATQFSLPKVAWEAWNQLGDEEDPRYILAKARAALASGDLDGVTSLLFSMDSELLKDPTIVELSVLLADQVSNLGHDEDYEVLLRRWAKVSPKAPEPISRQIDLLTRQGKLNIALARTDELAARGAEERANNYRLFLGSRLGEFTVASRAARALGQHSVADRLDARIAMAASPDAAAALRVTDPMALLVRAQAQGNKGMLKGALNTVDSVLRLEPYFSGALVLKLQLLERLGRREEADEVLAVLRHADPQTARNLGKEGRRSR